MGKAKQFDLERPGERSFTFSFNEDVVTHIAGLSGQKFEAWCASILATNIAGLLRRVPLPSMAGDVEALKAKQEAVEAARLAAIKAEQDFIDSLRPVV